MVVTLVIVGLLVVGGYYGWSYYKVLDLTHRLSTSLDTVHRYRGTARITQKRVRNRAEQLLQEAGGKLEPDAVRVSFTRLTSKNAATLPDLQRQKLSLACYNRRLQEAKDRRIDNARAGLRGRPRRPRRRAPSIRPPPVRPGAGVSCSAERLADLDYTLVQVEATVQAQAGWVSREVSLERVFYLPQHPE
jgi:hypothetical protein